MQVQGPVFAGILNGEGVCFRGSGVNVETAEVGAVGGPRRIIPVGYSQVCPLDINLGVGARSPDVESVGVFVIVIVGYGQDCPPDPDGIGVEVHLEGDAAPGADRTRCGWRRHLEIGGVQAAHSYQVRVAVQCEDCVAVIVNGEGSRSRSVVNVEAAEVRAVGGPRHIIPVVYLNPIWFTRHSYL